MKNTRNNGQKQVKNCLKWTASGLLLALMFVLVFAGTLSGAFGIENELQQNGIIQSNVASAAGNSASTNSNSITANNLNFFSALNKTDYVNNWSTGKTFTIGNLVQSNLAYTLYWWDNELAFSNASVTPEDNGSSFIMSTNKTSDRNYEDRCQRLITYLSIQLPTPLINLISNGSCVVTAKATFTYTKDDDQFVSMTVIEGAERLTTYSDERRERRENGNDPVTHNSWLNTGQSAEMEKSKTLSSNTKFITLAFYSRVRTNWARSIGLKWSNISLKFQSTAATDTTAPFINQSGLGQNKFIFGDQNSGLYQIYSRYNNGVYTEITSSCSLTADKKSGNILYQNIGVYDFLAIDNYGNIKEESYYVAYDINDKELDIKNRADFDGFALIISKKKTNFANRTFKIVPDADDPNQNITKYELLAGTYIDMLATNYTPGGYYDYGAGLAGSFQGTLDGNGCSIINLNIKLASNQARAGIIGTLDGNGCIKNLTIRNGTIDTTDKNDAGAFVGFLNGTNARIENCINYASVGEINSQALQLGGICGNIGTNGGTIIGCKNYGDVTGKALIGGIVGYVQGKAEIKNCYNKGDIIGTNPTEQNENSVTRKGVFVGGITGYTTDKGTISNCYNTGTIAAHSASNGYIDNGDYVGGIVGFAQAKVEYCANIGGLIDGNNFIGGIVGSALSTTNIDHCYDVQGQRQFRWEGCNHGAITGNGGNVTNSWAINEKPLLQWNSSTGNQTSASTKNRALTTPTTTDFEVVPQFYDGVNYVNKVWTNILDTNINGFSVSGGVDPSKSQFFESKKGSNSNSEYLTPNKTENSNQENALDRDNEASFTVTAWYGAATESDIYCAVNTINIDTSADTYNGNQHGFTRSDVTTPGKSGSVYGIVFDYKGKNPNEIFVCAFDSNGNIVAGSTNPTQVDTYNTTVFVKIGDIVVGKKINVDYTINKATLDVGWEWTDKLHSNLYNRTGDGNKEVQLVYNRQEQGLSSISDHLKNAALFKVTGSEWTNIDAATYERTYTLIDTRNYKLNFTNSNTGLTDSATSVEFKWTIRKNKLTVYNYWTGDDLNPSSEFYTFEFNTTHQGLKLQDGIKVGVEPDTSGNSHKIATDAYEIAQGVECIAANTADTSYTRTFTIKDTTNYEVEKIYSFNTNLLPNQKGVAVNAEKSVVTYTWKIVPFDLAANINKGNVWFGGATDLVVSNQGIANVEVGNQSYPDMRFYPLQADKKGTQGVQQVLVYAQYNYAPDKFVLYVKYNNGDVVKLTQGQDKDYTVGTLDTTNNTVGTFDVNVVSQAKPVDETNVTAKGTGNFSGIVTKYYTAMYSDFGGNVTSKNWGSQGNPYVISTPEHLLRLSQIVNGGKAWNSIQNSVTAGLCISPQDTAFAKNRAYSGAFFTVSADIDMSGLVSTDGVYNFLPIGHKQGNVDMPFSGTFDGKKDDNTNFQITFKYDITDFESGARVDYVGLFGYLNGATVQNVNVTAPSGATVKGRNYVGLVAGYAINSTLFNALGKYGGTVEGTGDYVGGIVGYAENTTIQSNGAASNAQVKGRFYVGGIVGKWIVHSEAQIGGSKAGQASITPASNQQIHGVKYVGGLVGWLDTSKCDASVEYTPQLKNTGHTIGVFGTEYVGALFGALIGNGYHKEQKTATGGAIYTAIGIDSGKVGNIKLGTRVYGDGGTTYQPKVVGGLVGYVESAGLAFLSDWNTANISFEFSYTVGNVTQFTEPSFFGGVVGVLGQNATMEAPYESKDDGSFLFGASYMITNNTEFGASNPLGSFVGGIVGYVSSQAGTYWESTTTIFGNGIALVNSANIYATGYVGGIFGALGDIVVDDAVCNEINAGEGDEYKNILKKVVASGVRTGNANTTLGIAPATKSEWVDNAVGKLHNMASVSATGKYVGGILGYSGAKVRVVLRNAPQNGAVDLSKLNVYSAGANVAINGSYVGGIAGYLSFGLDHELQYVVVQAKFANANATRVGGLLGYMGSGKVERCVVTSPDGTISASTDNYQGAEYVGGLVGETQTAIIRNSVSTGFKLAQTTNTKGGLLGYGSNPTLEASWTFYVASGATYSTVSKNTYGKYILVDSEIIVKEGSSYPPFADLCKFVGLDATGTADSLAFAVKVPSATDSDTLKNKQLAFYNASGNDQISTNFDNGAIVDFGNVNQVVTVKLNMAIGTSMQICTHKVEFVNAKKWNADNTLYTTDNGAAINVENAYKKPSTSDRYTVKVTNNNNGTIASNPTKIYDDNGDVRYILADVYIKWNDANGVRYVTIGETEAVSDRIGSYDSGELTPGSSADNPLTISNQKEWNDFAWNVYSGANDYAGQYVKLLTSDVVIDNKAHYGTASGIKPLNFGNAVTKTPTVAADANDNVGYNFAGNISQGAQTVSQVTIDGVKGAKTPSFKGHFDGNGNTITINYNSGGYHRVSVFPNASNATFKHLTIKGTIQAASQADGKGNETNENKDTVSKTAAYDIAGFVGKPFGSLSFYNCTNEAEIIGLRNVAGLVGYNAEGNTVSVEACVNIGNITSLQGSYTLGGKNSTTYNYDDGLDGTGVGETNVGYTFGTGGIIGSYIGTIQIESCRNSGNIIGGHNVGGIIGLHNGKKESFATLTINNCANTGNILANSGYWGEDQGGAEDDPSRGVRQSIFGYAGGLVGKTSRYSSLKMFASYNTGTVTTYSNIVGGLVGAVGALSKTSKNTSTDTLLTGSKSVIAYCYNNGAVHSGGTYPKQVKERLSGRENYGGTISGGIAGIVGNIKISNCYNTGDITSWGVVGYSGSWQLRSGGIVGQSEPTSDTYVVEFETLYNAGSIMAKAKNTHVGVEWIGIAYYMNEKLRYGGAISGYCDHSNIISRITSYNVYSIKYPVGTKILNRDTNSANKYKESDYVETDFHAQRRGDYLADGGVAGIGASQEGLTVSGTTFDSYEQLTAHLNASDDVVPRATEYTDGNRINIIQSIETLTEGIDYTQPKSNGKMYDGWIYVYGCLPQLAMFALDTQNGLSMHSIGYRKDQYGEYNATGESAGSDQYPYIIKDGIDLMGMQALVDNGFDFNGKIIEFANSTNNLAKTCSETIVFPTTSSTTTNLKGSNAYKAKDSNGNYYEGKSYHLFAKGALCNLGWSDEHGNVNSVAKEYGTWIGNNYRNNGESANTTLSLQNFISIGRNGNSFKGTINGQQGTAEASFATIIDSLRITIKGYAHTNAGLFSSIDDATIQYVGIGGDSKISSYEAVGTTVVTTAGGIAGMIFGNSVVENCIVKDSTIVGAYGNNAYAGGIAGMADPKQGNTYNAGITTTIRNCSISTSGRIESENSNIGGIVGYVKGDEGAVGKGNSVRIEGCKVQKAAIQAASSAKASSHIGGVLGYGSEFVPAFITGCEVGTDTGTVTIKGEHSLGGIAGGMSNAKGGYIDSCIVGANTTIERIDQGGDASVSENPKHGTAIGGLVGFTEDSTDAISPLTTTFSGTSSFSGSINVTVAATNSAGFDAAISQIGGIVGDMGSGAHFASGSDVTVGGAINIKNVANDGLAAANVGGVAGRTSNATFIGKFDVRPTMTTPLTENVGGFIGKNVGTVYILADTTERIVGDQLNGTAITIGGKIQGTSEVGGFIGVNNSGSSLNIGSNVANAKPYTSGTLSITIATGATISGSGNNVGGIVGKNEGVANADQNDYATIDIVKGTIEQNGTISGKNYVGGIIGLNAGLLTTGGGEADEIIGGIALDENQIGDIKNLLITNKGNVKGGVTENNNYVGGDCVGGVIGWLDAPQTLRPEHTGKGDIAGAFTNKGSVEGNRFVGGSLGYVGKYVNIVAKGDVDTLFSNTGNVTAHSTFVGGSIGAIVGQITGVDSKTTVNFENTGTVNGLGYVGGSIGVLAGPAAFAQFVNSSTQDFPIAACNSVGGSVGYIGMPDALKAVLDAYFKDNTYSDIDITVQNVHFEANGNLTAEPTDATLDAAKKDANGNDVADNLWGGVGGAIGVLGRNQLKGWVNNTYYANGSVIAPKVNNVGGIIGLINADNITIGNLLAYNITVTGAKNVGGIVGATNGTGTVIKSAYTYAPRENFTATATSDKNVGGIIGAPAQDTVADTSYWVLGCNNADIAGYDIKDLKGLGFSTGTAKTGWYFLYATDADGTNGLGKINTNHQNPQDVNADELKYWKRIANAYTAQERAKGEDKKDLVPKSDIVSGGQPQYATLYATAKAATVTANGYYMYTATSNKQVTPTVVYDEQNKLYHISVKTNSENPDRDQQKAENVAVFYRSVSSAKEALTYNGYLRNAITGLDGVELYTTPIADNTTPTIKGKENKYIYTATTSITENGTTTTLTEAQSNPNIYTSEVKIYYVDENSVARLVGGNSELRWEIKARNLNVTFENGTTRKYGADESNTVDMTVSINNIAPNRGLRVPLTITVTFGDESVAFKWNGTAFDKTEAHGITVKTESQATNVTLDKKDKESTSEVITDENTHQLICKLFFKQAKTYIVTVSDETTPKACYTFDKQTGEFKVDPAELTITGAGTASVTFDNNIHGYEWEVKGFKYTDKMSVLAAFKPCFNGVENKLYTAQGLIAGNTTVAVNGADMSIDYGNNKFLLRNAKHKGAYFVKFENLTAGNYKLNLVGGDTTNKETKHFVISENALKFEWSNGNYSHTYNGSQTGKFSVTISTTKGVIEGFETFISNYYTWKISNSDKTPTTSTSSGQNSSSITISFETGVNAKDYTASIELNKDSNAEKFRKENEANCAVHSPESKTYTINKRPLTLTTTMTTGTSPYTYNTSHQGLATIKVDDLVENDKIGVTIKIGTKTATVELANNTAKTVTDKVSTIDVNTYTASFALSTATLYTQNGNYTLSATNVTWQIDKYIIIVGEFDIGAAKTYNAKAEVPKINVTNSDVSVSGTTFSYGTDTFTLEYAVSYNNQTYASNNLVNAGTYKIKIGTSNGKIHAQHSDGKDASNNYDFGNNATEHTYVIKPCEIKIVWETKTFVYNASNRKLNVASIEINNTTKNVSNNTVQTGLGKDKLTFNRGGGGTNVGSYTTNVTSHSVSVELNDGVKPIAGNYKIVSGATSDTFNITPSKLKIFYANGATSKVYDATTTVKDNNFTFTVSSTNGGAHGTSELFTISYVYTDKNVGDKKEIAFTYEFKQNANYEYVGTGSESKNVGQITPAHIKVALNRLRSGKATRTFTNNVWYGGKDGASGNVNSTVYRSGEGFTVSGVLSSDAIKVVAEYREADDSRNGTGNSFNLSSYVNDVEEKDGTFDMAAAGTHYFKTLVFTMTGTDAKNYTFNVYGNGTDGKKYSEKDSTAGDTQTVTVYDTDDKANGHQNASGAEQIHIEITVKSVRVTYNYTAQSYANNDNTYNTAWDRVTGTNQDMQGAGADIVVTNGWMYKDGKDRPADSTEPKREYHGYTTIRGNATSQLLGASVSKKDGMNLNYRLSNQPTLTIAYFVDNTGTYEIDTLARLLIASFYYTAHQNPGDQIFMQIVQSGYKWFEVVKGEDYSQVEFAVPENSPITVADTINSWDAYINALNEAGYAVFYNETEKAWGCYVSDSSQSTSLPNSYKLTKDISGKFTADDIRVLDAFFTVTTTDDNGQSTTTKYTWNGANSDYLQNVLSAAVDKVATVNGSLFVSTKKAEGTTSPMGFDGTFDGNGYVIEYLNIMGYGKENVGLFDIIGANGIVKNLHLRNITINANKGNVGGIAGSIAATEGDADATKNVTNVSFHGKITASGSNVGGLFGTSARAIAGAIVLGEISATNANVGGVVGTLTATASLSNVVSMMQITAIGGTVGVFASTQNPTIGNSFHMKNAVWKRPTSGTGFVNVVGKNVNYNALMSGSNSLYANGTSESGTYDVIDETFADSGQNVNPRQSKRLRDMVSVYLLMYSLSVNNGKYTISSSSWLVGTADGTTANPIAIANKQNVSLLRELRFATFTLKANVSIDVARTFTGAFYGSVTSAVNESGVSYGYKITCNKSMFEEYATVPTAWLVTPTQP